MGVDWTSGIFEVDNCVTRRPSRMLKLAFMLGSSKHGKARRASVGCICDTAKYLNPRKARVIIPVFLQL